ncbi:protoglobin family protein [Alienimonas sp. DA493]|uniref:protoglobin family protein n=1 Tax=Alienimonas sp. DA493 TaxID=3373605 RepID=UPI00375437AC
MQHVDESRLESDLAYRFEYLADFVGFGEEDVAAVHGSAGALGPLVPGLVDAVYDKLFAYDATRRHFVPRQHGYEREVPADLNFLTTEHEMIAFRKQHLGRYLTRLVTRPYDGEMVKYLDFVGAMHTPHAGNPHLNVPLVQMNALMGFVSDALTATICGLGLERDAEVAALRAFGKLLWIQNDLINRHYAAAPGPAAA